MGRIQRQMGYCTTNYDEKLYKEMSTYINEAICNYEGFYEYRTNSNYHSFDSYSILEQYEICQDFINECEK